MTRKPEHEEKACIACGARPHEPCITISGKVASQAHLARWLPAGSYREHRVYSPYKRRKNSR